MNGIQFRLRNLVRKFRTDDASEFIYVFNHIPKAGGTAARFVFNEWHAVVTDYRKGPGEQETRAYVAHKLELRKIRRPAIVSGHYGLPGARLHERYPEVFVDPRYRLITFLRDPLETALSTYFYVKKLGRPGFSDDLDHYLTHYRTGYTTVLNCADGNYDRALAHYWFVGITERFSDSIRLLGRMMDKDYFTAPVLNVTPRGTQPSAEAIGVFRSNNAEDYALYNAAVRDFERAFGKFEAGE